MRDAIRRDEPNITGWISLRRIRRGQKRVENTVAFRRPPRTACWSWITRDLHRVAFWKCFNPDLRYTVNITNESDSVAVRRKARLPVCPGESRDPGDHALFRLGNILPGKPPYR